MNKFSKSIEDSNKRMKKNFQESKEKIRSTEKKVQGSFKKRFKKLKKQDVFVFLFLFISAIAIICFLRNYNPEKIVNFIGIENIYLTIFIFALIGGVSFFTATYFYAAFFIFIAGGINPFFLALTVAIGLTIGDLFFYLVGLRGSPILENYFKRKEIFKKVNFIQKKMKKYEFLTIYLYAGFLPFPKDILSFALGFFGHRLKNIIIPLFLGNLTYNIILAYLFLFGMI